MFNPIQFYEFGKKRGGGQSMVFDTIKTPDLNAFEIRRSSDQNTAIFKYSEITNGAYSTFLGGDTGFVINWFGNNGNFTQSNTALQMALVQNNTKPFLNDTTQQINMSAPLNVSMSNDWIVSCVVGNELNNNNGRQNLTIYDSSLVRFSFAIDSASKKMDFYVDKNKSGTMTSIGSFVYGSVFALLTVSKIGGVIKVYKNGVLQTLGAQNYAGSGQTRSNVVLLGDRGDGLGKINQYKHIAILSSQDFSSFNIASYNSELVNRYI